MRRLIQLLLIAALLLSGVFPGASFAAESEDIDKLTTFATLLGRAAVCCTGTETALAKVGKWIDRHFPPGSSDRKAYLPTFISEMEYHAKMQGTGKSPDPCSTVCREFRQVDWDSATKN